MNRADSRRASTRLIGAWALAAATAAAQPATSRGALQAQAEAAYRAGRHADALDLALRAANLGMTPPLRLFLAVQHEALGHLLDARSNADLCVHETEAAAQVAQRETILARCQQMVTALDARLARVVVRVGAPAPAGLHVMLQGASLDPARWNAPVPVLPGAVRVEAWRDEGPRIRRELTLAAGATEEVRFDLADAPTPVVASPPTPAVAPTPEAATHDPLPPPLPPPTAQPHRAPVAPWIVAGVGVASLGAGAVLLALREAAVSSRDATCPANACADDAAYRQGLAHDDDARALQTGAWVAFGVGAAAVAGGVVWWLATRGPSGRAITAQVTPWWLDGARGAGLGVTGRF